MTPASARSFNSYAEVYERFALLWGGTIHDHLRRELPTHAGRAVDLGCGTGHHAALLAERCDHVLGVDVSAPMLDVAHRRRTRPTITYEQRDLREVTPERDGWFDVVFSAYTLRYVPDLDAALRGIRRLVAPAGGCRPPRRGRLAATAARLCTSGRRRPACSSPTSSCGPAPRRRRRLLPGVHPSPVARALHRRPLPDPVAVPRPLPCGVPGGRIDTFRRTRALH